MSGTTSEDTADTSHDADEDGNGAPTSEETVDEVPRDGTSDESEDVSDDHMAVDSIDSGTEEAESEDDDPAVQLQRVQLEAVDNYDRYLRAAAELDNFRKRAVRMRAESREETLRDVLLQIAPLMDNMRRALAQEAAGVQSLKQGFELILNEFQSVLLGYGLEEIEAVGHLFDPNLHEAMLQVESDEHDPGTVMEEMEKGYRLKDKVLRPSRVVVSKVPAEDGEKSDADKPEENGAEETEKGE